MSWNPFKSKPIKVVLVPPATPTRPATKRTTCFCCGMPLRNDKCPMCTGALDGVLCECQRP